MKKWSRRIRKLTADILELPKDVTLDFPRITMIGHLQIYIENHRGVLQFDHRELRLLLTKGQLLVKGSNLVIRTIFKEEVFLEGEIESIHYIDSNL
ncbi:sporulation protein YqfC [Microaerobacter geothermalis]|uniref:sporulation protein YqfC n=1 Tax=Microaerobacter geothermalis TaxID=674972 RepID=UPI001F3B5735|nr:sporulation protein YqfC [Microaerobacter geothermalis]MCF6092827.1 sporulation protein YqfC [Microaerobacter geothermalis]